MDDRGDRDGIVQRLGDLPHIAVAIPARSKGGSDGFHSCVGLGWANPVVALFCEFDVVAACAPFPQISPLTHVAPKSRFTAVALFFGGLWRPAHRAVC